MSIGIDNAALYGYWERADGSVGGSLWFKTLPTGQLSLKAYDGASELPKRIIMALRAAGYHVGPEFE